MPFKSKRQQRLFFSGALPGVDKKKALEFAHETPNIKKLPDRAPAEKGKPTLRSKKASFLFPKKKLVDAPELVALRQEHPYRDEHDDHKDMHPAHWHTQKNDSYDRALTTWNERQAAQRNKKAGSPNDRMHDALAAKILRNRKKTAAVFTALEPVFAELFKVAALPQLVRANAHFGNAVKILKSAPPTALHSSTPQNLGSGLRSALAARKTAGLGSAASSPGAVGKFKGMMTTNALKTPGYAASTNAINPRKSIIPAMNATKPH